MRFFRVVLVVALAASRTPNVQAQPSAWRDPSPHRAGAITVNGARLHYLDWGGRGSFLLLIHGWNSNAHVFDDLAPRLTDRYRVVALTLRGFGESDTVSSDYSLDRYADDLRITLDSFHVRNATVVAHSFGGWVLTRTVLRYPRRVRRAVYLDAAFDMRASDSVIARRPVRRPALGNVRSPADVIDWLRKDFFGMWTPALEAEYRARPKDENARAIQLERVGNEAEHTPPNWAQLSVPALAICALANMSSEFPWLNSNDSGYTSARRYVDTERRPRQRTECKRFRASRSDHRILELSGHHYVFIWHPTQVARAIRALVRAP